MSPGLSSNYAYHLVNILENRWKMVEIVLEIEIKYERFSKCQLDQFTVSENIYGTLMDTN